MPTPPFLLATPTDMLAKARRELQHLRDRVSVDSVFNYFVTAYHVSDYLLVSSPATRTAVLALYADPDFLACKAICNQGKHLRVDRKARPASQELSGRSGLIGVGMVGAMMVGAGEEWDLTYDGVPVDPLDLGERVLSKLAAFFVAHGLPTGQE